MSTRDPAPSPLSAGLDAALQQVAALTARMLDASEQHDWALVSELEAARSSVLHGLPPAAFTPGQQAVLRDALAATHLITDRIRGFQATERNALDAIRQGSRGALSYLNVATAR